MQSGKITAGSYIDYSLVNQPELTACTSRVGVALSYLLWARPAGSPAYNFVFSVKSMLKPPAPERVNSGNSERNTVYPEILAVKSSKSGF